MEVHSERSSYIKKLNLLLRKTSPWGWSYTEPCCPYRVWGLHPWRCSELNWTQPWAACSDCAVSFEQMTWPNNLQRPLSTQTILWSHWIEDSAIWNQCWMSHNWDSRILTASGEGHGREAGEQAEGKISEPLPFQGQQPWRGSLRANISCTIYTSIFLPHSGFFYWAYKSLVCKCFKHQLLYSPMIREQDVSRADGGYFMDVKNQ